MTQVSTIISAPNLRETLAIEERALDAWPALQTKTFAGWALRFAGGATKRANSVNPIAPNAEVAPVLAPAHEFYRQHGLPTIFRLTPLAAAGTDARLECDGFRRQDDSLVLSKPIDRIEKNDDAVLLAHIADDVWRHGFASANGIEPAARPWHERILDAIAQPAVFATFMQEGEAVAYGLAVAERGMVGLFDIVTKPAWRRSGAASRLIASLIGWGAMAGAQTAYLQVVVGNHAARALYGKLGFAERYQYHYRILD
ncbi:GNAT family N-acetyltransferase [Telmatospirillum sp.]|uniref:GNAT family N-acetyltransferase n=1 Tax=Telmatospirillum sp. TaxID=2079197 RepID=UPI002848ACB4|nr:GNAT family N-acetyltransferase [Telmatospirillum sp.]MDR3439353.1 GNAT family N-acetyltransferase [Telmatospirillum sp.]